MGYVDSTIVVNAVIAHELLEHCRIGPHVDQDFAIDADPIDIHQDRAGDVSLGVTFGLLARIENQYRIEIGDQPFDCHQRPLLSVLRQQRLSDQCRQNEC